MYPGVKKQVSAGTHLSQTSLKSSPGGQSTPSTTHSPRRSSSPVVPVSTSGVISLTGLSTVSLDSPPAVENIPPKYSLIVFSEYWNFYDILLWVYSLLYIEWAQKVNWKWLKIEWNTKTWHCPQNALVCILYCNYSMRVADWLDDLFSLLLFVWCPYFSYSQTNECLRGSATVLHIRSIYQCSSSGNNHLQWSGYWLQRWGQEQVRMERSPSLQYHS